MLLTVNLVYVAFDFTQHQLIVEHCPTATNCTLITCSNQCGDGSDARPDLM